MLLRAILFSTLLPLVGCATSNVAPVAAPAAGNPLSEHENFRYGVTKNIILAAAERMPEEHYAFKPVQSVRSYGQILGHIADANYRFCSAVIGEKLTPPQIEKTRTSKAELVAALNEAFAYCDRAYGGMTDALAVQKIPFFGADTPKLSVLSVNAVHTIEHYGNLVTYMRMKDLVPPTSDQVFMSQFRHPK